MAELKATRFSVTESGVATIMLSRPEALNALNGDLNNELMQHFRFCDQSNDVKVVILTGDPASVTKSGQTIFCAGADLGGGKKESESEKKSPPKGGGGGVWAQDSISSHRDGGGVLALAINRCRKPVIAESRRR